MRGACESCLRRAWLLAQLSATLDYHAGQEERLLGLLELADEQLIEALAGRRRQELERGYSGAEAREPRLAEGVEAICVHDGRYPESLRSRCSPRALYVAGRLDRLHGLLGGPVVGIVGTRRATDYGMVMAQQLARSLARCGVCVLGSFAVGIARAVVSGVIEAGAPGLFVIAGGVDVCRPAAQLAAWASLREGGCLVSELPCRTAPRRWSEPARERIIAALCDLLVVVEAGPGPAELRVARMATHLGKPVGALPGRLTSQASQGTIELLSDGHHLIRGPADVLEVLALGPAPRVSAGADVEFVVGAPERLEARLQAVLDRVGAGEDTVARLTADGRDPGGMMAALAELELLGRLQRGDAGRYVPTL